MRLSGKVAWVIGGSSGIGAAVARELVSRSATVAISARRKEQFHDVAGTDMLVRPADVTDAASVSAAVARVQEELGPIDLAVLPGMLLRHHGVIAGIASVAGYRGLAGAEAYGATKAAQINMLESLRVHIARTGVHVTTICPGFVRTHLTAGNRFPMPFIIDADQAARSICDGLERERTEIVFPAPMALLMKTVVTVNHHGDGGIGTTYLNTSTFLGRKTQLTYIVREFIPGKRIQLRGENKTVTAVDTMTFRSIDAGTEVIYTAEFTFKAPARLLAPLLRPAFERLAQQAQAGMRKALNQL
jgi:NAD(P)-dependent dehydrogenase (short-subunit alcohol dehydrogenase family)